jgi:hypothetical protein
MLVTKFGKKVFDASSLEVESLGLTCCEAEEGRCTSVWHIRIIDAQEELTPIKWVHHT